jgi:hypothetical protein
MRFVTYASPNGGNRVGVVRGSEVRGFEPGLSLLDMIAYASRGTNLCREDRQETTSGNLARLVTK